MMTAQMLSLASGCAAKAASSAATAVAAQAHTDTSTAGATRPSAAAHEAHPLFSSLMRGLSTRQPQAAAKRSDDDTPTGDSPASATEQTLAAPGDGAVDGDASKPGAETAVDLPGMAMPLLPTAVDLSINAALQAATAAQSAQAALAVDSQRPAPGEGSQAVAANLTMTATAAAGSPWPASPGDDDRNARRPAASRAAATANAAAGLPADGSAPPAGTLSAAAAMRFSGSDDAAGDPGRGRTADLAAAAAPAGNGDRGNSTRSETLATAPTSPLPDSLALPSQAGTLPAVTVKLPDGAPAQWRQALSDALGERLQVQVSRNVEQAVIRLDPPNLGRIDISISQASGSLQVHLSASNADVLRQLHEVGATLRQDLTHRQYGDVAVTVADTQSRGGDSRQRGRQAAPDDDHAPGKALAEAETGHTPAAYGSYRERE